MDSYKLVISNSEKNATCGGKKRWTNVFSYLDVVLYVLTFFYRKSISPTGKHRIY